jgi:hypothetical protein
MATINLKAETYKSDERLKFTIGGTAVTAGTPTQITSTGLVGIPVNDIAANGTDEFDITGRKRCWGVASQAWTVGQTVGYDTDGDPYNGTAGTGAFTTDEGDWNFPVGTVVEAKASTEEMGIVLLNEFLEGASPGGSAGLMNSIADPGNAGAIPVGMEGHVKIVTAGAETRTIADPTIVGQQLLLTMQTDGGDCVITTASPWNQNGNTTITLDDVGDAALLVACRDGADIEWRGTLYTLQSGGSQAAVGAVTTIGTNTGTPGAGLSLIGDTTMVNQATNLMNDMAALREDIAAVFTLANALRSALVDSGIIKGAA